MKQNVNFESFKRNDIKEGYVVKLRNGDFRMAMPIGCRESLILISPNSDWSYLSNWDDCLSNKGDIIAANFNHNAILAAKAKDIVEVYGRIEGTDFYGDCRSITTAHRPLLWTRTPPKKMTVSEISEALGYPVEIVAEASK